MTTLSVSVGGRKEMGERFIAAWKRAEAGDTTEERHITFETWEQLTSTLTESRLELLRHLRTADGADSTEALAKSLGREHKDVREDVQVLEDGGFIERMDGRLVAPWEVVVSQKPE
ncbi:hypothetical protein [Paraburkholderia sp. JHI869]|uniref:HVO_A0114 family putative DNA-binding protein n=1 Tax=Paraburkholderia sp. JHI869 TaxID=3112959 RepID=UPI00317A5C74